MRCSSIPASSGGCKTNPRGSRRPWRSSCATRALTSWAIAASPPTSRSGAWPFRPAPSSRSASARSTGTPPSSRSRTASTSRGRPTGISPSRRASMPARECGWRAWRGRSPSADWCGVSRRFGRRAPWCAEGAPDFAGWRSSRWPCRLPPGGLSRGEIRILQRDPRSWHRPPGAPCGSAPPPCLRAGAGTRRLRGQGDAHLSSLPAQQLAARRDHDARGRRVGAPLGFAAPGRGGYASRARHHRAHGHGRRLSGDGEADRQRHGGHERDGARGVHGLLLRASRRHPHLLHPSGLGNAGDPPGPHRISSRGFPHRAEGADAPLRAGPRAALLLGLRELHGGPGKSRGRHHRPVPDAQPERLQVPPLARDAQRGGPLPDRVQGGRELHAARAPDAPVRCGRLAWHVSALSLRRGRRPSPGGRPLARAALGAYRVHPARLLHLRLHRALRRERRAVGALLPQEPGLLRDARLSLRPVLQPGRRLHRRHGLRPPGGVASWSASHRPQGSPRRQASGALRGSGNHGRLREPRADLRFRAGDLAPRVHEDLVGLCVRPALPAQPDAARGSPGGRRERGRRARRAQAQGLGGRGRLALTMACGEARAVEVNGLCLRLWEWGGSGPPALLLHSLAAHSHWWDWAAPLLATRFSVIALDLRGHGESSWAEPAAYHASDYAGDIVAVLDHLAWEAPLVIGHSLGGYVGAWLAAHHADRVGALVIADTMTQWSEEETAWALRQSERPGPEFAHPGEAGARYRLSPPETAATAECLGHLGEAAVVERAVGVWQYAFDRKVFAQARPDAWSILPKIACPTLVVRGEGSGIMDRAAMLRVATTVPRGQFAELKGAWHHLVLDDPARFVSLVTDWVERTKPGAAAGREHS